MKSLVERIIGDAAGPNDQPERTSPQGIWECPECGTLNAATEEEAERAMTEQGLETPIVISAEPGQCANCHPQQQHRMTPNYRAQRMSSERDFERYESARRIVAGLIEDAPADFSARAGGPDDAWRKGGHKPLKGLKFTGKRSGDKKGQPAGAATKPEAKKHSRFSWKPGA